MNACNPALEKAGEVAVIQPIFYKIYSDPLVCCICVSNLDQDKVDSYNIFMLTHAIVKPTCGSPDCGAFQTSRPRKVPLKCKRKASKCQETEKATRFTLGEDSQERDEGMKTIKA